VCEQVCPGVGATNVSLSASVFFSRDVDSMRERSARKLFLWRGWSKHVRPDTCGRCDAVRDKYASSDEPDEAARCTFFMFFFGSRVWLVCCLFASETAAPAASKKELRR